MIEGNQPTRSPSIPVRLIGVSRSWLYEAAKEGRIPCVRLGGPDGPVRFKARDLEAWIEGGRVTNSSPAVPTSSGRLDRSGRRLSPPPDVTQLRLLSDGAV